MQAIERVLSSSDWVTFLFILGLILLFVMKLYQPKRLVGYSLAFFVKGFILRRSIDNTNFFSLFHGVLFLFNVLVFSLFISFIFLADNNFNFQNFSTIFLWTITYVTVRFMFDILLESLFDFSKKTRYFRYNKIGYLYTISLWLFPALILYFYQLKSKQLLLIIFGLLFLTRMALIINNNKKLIFSHFFYFILYLCALEIAPLFLLYKTTTT